MGVVDEGAFLVCQEKQKRIITKEDEGKLKGVKAGINLPVFFHGDVIGVIGITGDPANVSPYGELLKDDPIWAERAKSFVAKIKDVSVILVELGFHLEGWRLPEQIVTYQDSCHLRNVMKTANEPRLLLQSISGVEFREMKDADRCCGSAGIYNIIEPDMSMQVLDYKMAQVKQTKATTIVTANPGCLLQMKLGIEREGLTNVRAVHLVELLLEAVEATKEANEPVKQTG